MSSWLVQRKDISTKPTKTSLQNILWHISYVVVFFVFVFLFLSVNTLFTSLPFLSFEMYLIHFSKHYYYLPCVSVQLRLHVLLLIFHSNMYDCVAQPNVSSFLVVMVVRDIACLSMSSLGIRFIGKFSFRGQQTAQWNCGTKTSQYVAWFFLFSFFTSNSNFVSFFGWRSGGRGLDQSEWLSGRRRNFHILWFLLTSVSLYYGSRNRCSRWTFHLQLQMSLGLLIARVPLPLRLRMESYIYLISVSTEKTPYVPSLSWRKRNSHMFALVALILLSWYVELFYFRLCFRVFIYLWAS